METLCCVIDCDRKRDGGSKLCGGHRKRKYRTGSTDGLKRVPPPGVHGYAVMLFNGWTVTPSGCWEYNGPRFAKGYGQVKIDGSPKLAHRIAYQESVGPIPEGLLIRHTCDNPPCVNPAHLVPGTSQQNADDCVSRNRQARGMKNANAKLTDEQVLAIRARLKNLSRLEAGPVYRELGALYGVTAGTISNANRKITYRYVN